MTDLQDTSLQTLWQCGGADGAIPSPSELLDRANSFQSRLGVRNGVEYAPAGAVACVFAFYAFTFSTFVCRAGAGLICVASIFVVVVLRLRGRPVGAELGEACLPYFVSELSRQRSLLRWAWLWYVAPFLPGLGLFMAGMTEIAPAASRASLAIVSALIVAVCLAVIWLNARAANRLETLIHTLTRTQGES